MSEKTIEIIRMVAVGFLVIVAIVAISQELSDDAKAALLTMTGGAIIVVALFPARKPEFRDIGTICGTGIAVWGGWYWFSGETGEEAISTVLFVIVGAITISVLLALSGIFALVIAKVTNSTNQPRDPDDMRRDSRLRNVKKQLRRIARETTSVPMRKYSQYDATISTLFRDTWSMLDNTNRTTYDWKAHKELVENYAVARLERTAEIAVAKHPYQCKYAEIADTLAFDILMGLRPINVIRVFDPLPDNCPECKAPKPTHKANCMAAICWRCKYPTPPQKRDSDNSATITPRCHIPNLCWPRGEQLDPLDPIVTRIRLPFSIPQGNTLENHLGPTWNNRDRKRLRDFLEQLQQEEDRATE